MSKTIKSLANKYQSLARDAIKPEYATIYNEIANIFRGYKGYMEMYKENFKNDWHDFLISKYENEKQECLETIGTFDAINSSYEIMFLRFIACVTANDILIQNLYKLKNEFQMEYAQELTEGQEND